MTNEADSFVLFDLDGTTYALRSRYVRRLEMIEHITPVPNANPSVEGVVFSRGDVIPAISLRARFGLPRVDHDLRSRLIVVQVEDRKLGLVVDSSREFKRIPTDSIKPSFEDFSGTTGKYLEGIASVEGKLILVLTLDEVIKTADEISIEVEG